ncbi:hypothetical protein C8Q79DRAFT_167836 [Trametes meyenii]|nr:hypothetical protein C8Q79DRAFT_167836 [Trametes meyenii]
MSRDSRAVWQDVLLKMHEGPECPWFMNEPHYVALLFGRDCMGCGTAPGTLVALGWRLCQSCRIQNLILESEVKDKFRRVLYSRKLHNHPVFCTTTPKRRAFQPSDVLPHCILPVPGVKDKMRHFYAPEVDRFLAEYLPIILRLMERGDAAVEAWCLVVGRRRTYVAQVNEFLEDVRAFFEALSRPRTLRSQLIPITWRSRIVDRIRVLDFSPRDMPDGLPEWDNALSAYAVLSDEDWDRLRPVLLPHLEQKRAARLEGLRRGRVWGPNERLPHEEPV